MTSGGTATGEVRAGADGAYWDGATSPYRASEPGATWRSFSDSLHVALLDRWLGGRTFDRALKTDLFDESAGDGLAADLARRAGSVHGVDVSSAVAADAAARHPALSTARADVRRLPLRDGAVGLVVSNSTLDHLPTRTDLDDALAELRRVSGPGAIAVITLDNRAHPVVWLRSRLPSRWFGRSRLLPYYVGVNLTPEGLEGAVARAGFEVVDRTTLLHAPRVLVLPLCDLADARGTAGVRAALLRLLTAAEGLGRWPTRRRTGHYAAVLARVPPRGTD